MSISKSNTISDLHRCYPRANSLNNANTLMTQDLARLQVMLIGTAETRVSSLNENITMLEDGRCLVGNDFAFGRATEDPIRNIHSRHFYQFEY